MIDGGAPDILHRKAIEADIRGQRFFTCGAQKTAANLLFDIRRFLMDHMVLVSVGLGAVCRGVVGHDRA